MPVPMAAEAAWPVKQLLILGIGLLALFVPTYFSLAESAWLKDDNGHAPMIIALSFWLLWNDRQKLFAGQAQPAHVSGWAVFPERFDSVLRAALGT